MFCKARSPFQCGTAAFAALFVSCLLISYAFAIPIEQTISARMSIRQWSTNTIPRQQLLEVLRNAYGFSGDHRNIPQVGNAYSLDLFVANATGTYRYNPEQNTLTVHLLTITKEELRLRFDQGYPADASAVIIIVWNQTRMDNELFASAEAGLMVQNTYLSAVSLNLGTVCVGLIDSTGIRSDLGLSGTMVPLLVMPIGLMPMGWIYPSATPDYVRMTGNLPIVQNSTMSFLDSLNKLTYDQTWTVQPISTQDLSQLLWAAYGYSSTSHRTVPSAGPTYPFRIWALNATGAYEYTPESHSISQKLQGDRRTDLASGFGSQSWAANAAAIILLVCDTSGLDPSWPNFLDWLEIEAGCIAQNILLEAAAWNLSGNIVSQSFEEWDGTGATSIRSVLGLSSSLVPRYAVPVGIPTGTPASPSPSPTPSPSLEPSHTSSPEPSPTAIPTPTQNPSSSPTPNPTTSPSSTPQGFVPTEYVYTAIGTSIIALTCLALVLIRWKKKKLKKNEII